jgi:hypothetical protein
MNNFKPKDYQDKLGFIRFRIQIKKILLQYI